MNWNRAVAPRNVSGEVSRLYWANTTPAGAASIAAIRNTISLIRAFATPTDSPVSGASLIAVTKSPKRLCLHHIQKPMNSTFITSRMRTKALPLSNCMALNVMCAGVLA